MRTTAAALVLVMTLLPPLGCDGDSPSAPPPSAGETGPPIETRPDATERAVPVAAAVASSADGDANEEATDPLAAYAALLEEVVTPEGLVRYDRLATAPHSASLFRVVEAFARAPLAVEPDARLALWLNAYNANVLAFVLSAGTTPSFTSVKDVPGFFDRRPITVAGETMTLNDLENKHVRSLHDPRIHAALVCAAMSCPPLSAEPYVAERLNEQLDDQCRRWVNDPAKFRMVGGALGLSAILDWYGEDFRRPPYGNPTGFVLAYASAQSAITRYIVNTDRPKTEWLPYDWALNQAPIGDAPGREAQP